MENKQDFAQMQFEGVPVDPNGETEGFFPGLESPAESPVEPPEGFFGGEPDFDAPEAVETPVGAAAVVETERALPVVAPKKRQFTLSTDIIEERHRKIYNEGLSPTSVANVLSIMVNMGLREGDSALFWAHNTAHQETVLVKFRVKIEELLEKMEATLEKKVQEATDKAQKNANDAAVQTGKRTEQTVINLIEERIDGGTMFGRAKWAFFIGLAGFFFGQAVPTMRPIAFLFELIFTTSRING